MKRPIRFALSLPIGLTGVALMWLILALQWLAYELADVADLIAGPRQ